MSNMYYILDNKRPTKVDMITWARWTALEKTHVGNDLLDNGVHVSTVFIGLDHRHFGEGPPIVFETMIFGGPQDGYQERYCTWEEAEKGHKVALELAKEKV